MNKPKKKPLRYFFFEGELYKKQHIHRSADIITAWNYPQGKMVKLQYSRVRKEGQKAFTTKQVGAMIGRGWLAIDRAVGRGDVARPQQTYGIDEKRNPYAFYWREEDIMDLHAYFMTVHLGRPRNDGKITTRKLPTRAELRAMIRQGTVLYVRDSDGNFIPTWDAEQF